MTNLPAIVILVCSVVALSTLAYQRVRPVTCYCSVVTGSQDTGLRLSFEIPRSTCESFSGKAWSKAIPSESASEITKCSEDSQ